MANANLDFTGLSVTRTFTFPDATGTITLDVGSANIVTVGTITTGTWHGTKIGVAYGGTNADLSATGGTSQVLKQTAAGATITVGQLAAADLSNGTTGTGAVVLASVTTALSGDPQFFTPIAGGTVAPTATGANAQAFINPAGTLATLTLTLPTGAFKGQTLYATFTQIITALTVTGTNVGSSGKVAPTAAAVGDTFGWVWDSASSRWNRIV